MSRRVERRFVNPEQISRHLLCSICTDVFLDATRLFCSHTFCKKCITHWNKDHTTCPICRDEIQIQLMGKDLVADKMIQDLQVTCPNSGCTWKDTLENLEKHNKICSFSKNPDWLVKDQNYIKIEEESEDNSPSWADLKNFQPIAVGFQNPNAQILTRGNEDVYCMTYWHTFYAPNSETTQELFENVVNHSTRGGRRNSGPGYAFGIQNNIMIPIYHPAEEINTESREDDIIILDDSTSSSENPSSLGKSQKKKTCNDKRCPGTKPSRKQTSRRLQSINDDSNGNENNRRSSSRRELGKYMSIGEGPSENKLLKKTKTGVV